MQTLNIAAPFFLLLPNHCPFLFGSVPQNIDPSRIVETVLWSLAFIGFIIIGFAILLRIRREGKLGRSAVSSLEEESSLFRSLYQKKLITRDEYQTIQKRLRDQLVQSVLDTPSSPPPSPNRRSSSRSGNINREEQLELFLRNISEKNDF